MPYIKKEDFINLLHCATVIRNHNYKLSRVESPQELTTGFKCSMRDAVCQIDKILESMGEYNG